MPHRRRTTRTLLGLAVLALLLVWLFVWVRPQPTRAHRVRLSVYAAASLTDAVDALARRFEAAHPEVTIVPVYAASSTLARQIEAGAPADVFLSANLQWMDTLESAGLIEAGTRREPLGNRLVVVGPRGAEAAPSSPSELADPSVGRVAVADPAAVPAGIYARQALERLGLWYSLEGRLVIANDVRVAVAYAARGEVDAAVVYRTDAAVSTDVTVLFELPEAVQPDIRYAFGTVARPGRRADERAALSAFLAFLGGPEAGAVFQSQGFEWRGAAPSEEVSVTAPVAADRGSAATADADVVRLSLFVAVCAVLVCLPFGVAVGWLLARRRFRGKSLVENIANLPLVLPPAVTGFLLLVVLGRNGPVGGVLHQLFGIHIAFTWVAAVLAAAVVSFPLLVQSVRVAAEGVDPGLEEAARTLGAGPLRVAWTITLPLTTPGIVAGAVIAFARAVGELGATLVFAGNIPGQTQTISLGVWTRVSQVGGTETALRLVIFSVVISYASLFLASWLHRRTLARTRGRD